MTVLKNVVGTVDDIRPDASFVYNNARANREFSGSLDDYIAENKLPVLRIVFEQAVGEGTSEVRAVAVPYGSPEEQTLQPGERVACDFEPGRPGVASRLVSVRPL